MRLQVASRSKVPGSGREWRCFASALCAIPCALVALTFVVPWYYLDRLRLTSKMYRDEYSILDFTREGSRHVYSWNGSPWIGSVGDLMGHVAVVLVIALAASVAAGLLSYRFRMKLAVVAGVASVALMALASGLFYFGIMDALSQDKFSGWTNWNKSDTIITGPLIGWWMPLCAVTVQTFQVGILLYAMRRRRFLE